MSRGNNQKLKMLYLVKIFSEETDEQHAMTMPGIISKLNAYDVNADRKTLYMDFEELRNFGMDIIAEQRGRSTYYYLGERNFELSELKLLVDSVQSAKFIQAHSGRRDNISIYGQEANPDTWKMALMNLTIRGLDADLGPYHADTFTNDLHPTLKADFILANPPFNYHPWGQENLKDDPRWKYGLPPAGNANFAWIQHMIHHLAPNGKIGLVLANGALSTQSSGEGEIRKKIIEADLVEGIIAMPTQLFYSVTIPVTLWFITRNKKQKNKTVFIDARKMGHMVDRKHRDLSDDDIQKLANTVEAFQNGTLEDVKGFCAVATLDDIANQDYILTPGRYVGIEEQDEDSEPFEEKMARLTSELSEMFKKSHALEDEIRKKLGAIGYEL